VAERVVDLLEPIEIYHQDRRHRLASFLAEKCLRASDVEGFSIGKTGESVAVGSSLDRAPIVT